ncbi:MAG: hypothetical protein ACOCWE_04670 [Bacillota bacterium]
MKKFLVIMIAGFLLVGFTGLEVSADRGSIPFRPDVRIYEPLQQAIIAWNGEEQILILSTDLYASETTKVLEVIPLPAEPEVTEADPEIYQKVHNLYGEELDQAFTVLRSGGEGGSGEVEPAGEVTFQEKIGAQDISVTRVNRPADFVSWVNEYLSSQGVDNPTIPDSLGDVIVEYIEDSFDWFVFSVIELTEETHSQEAIQYRFKSDAAYFPLKITRTETGSTELEIMAFMPPKQVERESSRTLNFLPTNVPVSVDNYQIMEIDEGIGQMMSNYEISGLHHWYISGELSEFKEDLVVTVPTPSEDELVYYQGMPYYNIRQSDMDKYVSLNEELTDLEEEIITGEIEVRPLSEETFLTGPFIDDALLLNPYNGRTIVGYQNLLDKETGLHGYYIDEVEFDLLDLTGLPDFFEREIRFGMMEDDDRYFNMPAFYLTDVDGYEFICGEALYLESGSFSGNSNCFWHPEE